MKFVHRFLNVYSKLSLRDYLIVAFSFMILITVLSMGFISVDKYSDVLVDKTRNYSVNISTQVKKGLNSNLVDLDKRVDKLVKNPFIQDSLIQMERLDEQDKDKYINILEDNFDPYSINNLYINSIDLYLKNGATIYNGESGFHIKDIFESKFYTEGLKQPTTLCWLGYNSKTETIDAVRLVYDHDTYEVKGILIVRIEKKYLFEIFADYNMLEIIDMYIVDDFGQILSSKNVNNVGKIFDEGYKELMTKRSGFIEYKDKFILYQNLQNSESRIYQHERWKVIIVADRNLIYKDVYASRDSIIVLMIISIFFGILISIFISAQIAIPVKKLVKAMKEVKNGNFDIHIGYRGSSEMFFLIKSFNSMIAQIKSLINNVYKEKIIRKEMELRSLQAQINPHFLFNTLHRESA